MPDPYRARRWAEGGSRGAYEDMDPDVRPPGTEGALPAPSSGDGYPEGGTVADVLGWVGASAERAQSALGWERIRPTPRRTVVDPLERLLAAEGYLA